MPLLCRGFGVYIALFPTLSMLVSDPDYRSFSEQGGETHFAIDDRARSGILLMGDLIGNPFLKYLAIGW